MTYTPIANSPAEDVRLPSAIAPALSLLSVASPLPPLDTNVATARDGLPQSPGFKLDRTGCVTTEGISNCPSTVSEVQTVTEGGSGLTSFTLTFAGQTTGSIPAASTAATVRAALEALDNVGVGNVTVTGSTSGPYTVTFTGALAGVNVGQMTATPTGGTGTVTVATSTPGSLEEMSSMTTGATYPFAPFWLDSAYACDFSPTPGDRLYEIARTNLEAGTAWGVSRQLQTGTLNTGTTGQSPSLNATATVVDDSGEDLDIALGVLLNAWYTTVSQAAPAVLHLPAEFVPFALRHSMVRPTAGGTQLEVMPGLSVSIGPGYDVTTKPPGAPALTAHTAYVYLTGPIFVALGSIENAANPAQLPVSVDRLEGAHEVRQNKTLVVARRRALAMFDTCSVLAIAVNAPFLT